MAAVIDRPMSRHQRDAALERRREDEVDAELFEWANRQAAPEVTPIPVVASVICADQKTLDLHLQMEAEGVLADPSMAKEAPR